MHFQLRPSYAFLRHLCVFRRTSDRTNAITYYIYIIFTVLVILNVICDCGMVKAVDAVDAVDAVMCYTQGSVKVSVEVDY